MYFGVSKTMDILAELETFINSFNQLEDEDFSIDTIRIEFSKRYKLKQLKELGNWNRINANDKKIMAKLKKRLTADEVTSAYQLEKYNIYYYNSSTPPKYNKATMVIFAMKQYHKEPPPLNIINAILKVLSFGTSKVKVNIDLCLDFLYKPEVYKLNRFFKLTPFITYYGLVTDTRYINYPNIPMIEKIVIYDKQLKNKLSFKVWRIEAKMLIPDIRSIELPLYDFKQRVTDIIKKPKALLVAQELN
ncbi:MAG: hypothetical protein U9P72_12185 [Campylobacterota bacterium]|nr:hypothetical protein [Campylobacterota bacterium]